MTRIWRFLVGIVALALFLLAVVAVNQEQVSVRFLSWKTPEWSLYWWLLIAFFAGVGVGALTLLLSPTKGALAMRRLRKQWQEAEARAREAEGKPIERNQE